MSIIEKFNMGSYETSETLGGAMGCNSVNTASIVSNFTLLESWYRDAPFGARTRKID